jgi:Protein of unknown function (DUF1524).
MNYMDSFEWLLCPVCNSKTRIKLRLDTELKNFPLFCPKCKQETLISVHLLARFTSYVNVKMGNPSQFDVYVDRERKGNTFDIEHILPDDYSSYQDEFVDADDFQASRQMIGNLIILTRDKNRSYQAMHYQEKVGKYVGDNILAQALNTVAYQNNPKFLPLAQQYGFAPIPKFTKEDRKSVV